MSFTFHGFQSWQQCSSRGRNNKRFQECQLGRALRDWNTLNTHPILSLAFLTIFLKWRVKVVICCSSLFLDLWLVLCRRSLNHHMICRLLQILFPVLFHISEVQTCWHWTSYYLYLSIVQLMSVCPLHLLFLEGFEYHRQSMILLSPLFRNLYQIYVLRIGRGLTLTLGIRHFLLELHLMLFHWRQHIVVCWQKIMYPHTDFTINSNFFKFVQ